MLWKNGLPFSFLFLFVPLIPFLGRKRQVQRCPVCGWGTDEVRVSFCPYDGSPLQAPQDREQENQHPGTGARIAPSSLHCMVE